MKFLPVLLLPLALAIGPATLVAQAVTLPVGTQLPVSLPNHLPLHIGQPVRARLIYPVYDNNHLVLPSDTVVSGSVIDLIPDRKRRIRARLRGDLTPFSNPVVRFTSIELANGTSVPLTAGPAIDGAPIYKLLAPPPRYGGLIRQGYTKLKQSVSDQVAAFTAPEKGDRALQFLYSQLPYHPQRIEKETAWTVETTAPATFTAPVAASASPAPTLPPSEILTGRRSEHTEPATWILEAYLSEPMSSETSRSGETIKAVVAAPVLNPDGSVAVPQGSILSGTITSARPARSFARAGQLRFNFRQLTLPGEEAQSVRTSLKGADSSSAAQLAMDSEGNVAPRPQDKVLVPLLLLTLASRPLDHEEGGEGSFRHNAAASSTLDLVGFIAGTAAQQPYFAAALGYYSAALSIYDRIFARGKPVAFAKDTRIVLETASTRATVIKPAQ